MPDTSPTNAPLRAVKYLRSEHAPGFVDRGQVRIGTFTDFRRWEAMNPTMGDGEEGTVTEAGMIVEGTFGGPEGRPVPPGFDRFIVPGEVATRVADCYFEHQLTIQDVYAFCFSLAELPEADWRRMGYNAAVEIFEFDTFGRALTRALERMRRLRPDDSGLVGIRGPCSYRERVVPMGRGEEALLPWAAFWKHPRFGWQVEGRIVWTPATSPIEPLTVECGSLQHCCRRLF
jgi:hypothetical protein